METHTLTYHVEDTSRARLEATAEGVRRLQQSGLGLSAHWGLYSLSVEGSEWIYFTHRIPFDAYRQRMAMFNPHPLLRRGMG